jgi:NTP pyrophosphatase (non-canonical NTP hydrolase)
MKELNEYQKRAFATALPTAMNLTYMVLGLANEAGEVAGKLKKHIRGDNSLEVNEAIAQELGDVLWYVAGAAWLIGYSLEEIATMNAVKLEDRKERGKLQGDGDTR